nr:hypothetical protein [Pseudoxanthomonas spadix]
MAMQMERRRFWVGHVARFDASGLTRRQYCDRHCLAPATLDYWRRRARMEPAPAFVPVQARAGSVAVVAATAASVLHLRLGEVDLTLPADVDPTWLASLLRALR